MIRQVTPDGCAPWQNQGMPPLFIGGRFTNSFCLCFVLLQIGIISSTNTQRKHFLLLSFAQFNSSLYWTRRLRELVWEMLLSKSICESQNQKEIHISKPEERVKIRQMGMGEERWKSLFKVEMVIKLAFHWSFMNIIKSSLNWILNFKMLTFLIYFDLTAF